MGNTWLSVFSTLCGFQKWKQTVNNRLGLA